jgi:hypothetical protein
MLGSAKIINLPNFQTSKCALFTRCRSMHLLFLKFALCQNWHSANRLPQSSTVYVVPVKYYFSEIAKKTIGKPFCGVPRETHSTNRVYEGNLPRWGCRVFFTPFTEYFPYSAKIKNIVGLMFLNFNDNPNINDHTVEFSIQILHFKFVR